MDEFLLLESASLREKLCIDENISVLDKIGSLVLLPNAGYATTESLADFYQVPVNTIQKLSQRHKKELQSDGYKILSQKEFRDGHGVHLKSKARFLALYSRRACLRVGMLLTDSPIAKAVRTYLLEVEKKQYPITLQSNHLAEKLHQNAIQIGKHSEQLITQAGLIKAVICEFNKHHDHIKKIHTKTSDHEKRITALENLFQPQIEKHISAEQVNLLKDIVNKKEHRNISIWKKFNRVFNINRYIHLPEDKFDEAKKWLESYN